MIPPHVDVPGFIEFLVAKKVLYDGDEGRKTKELGFREFGFNFGSAAEPDEVLIQISNAITRCNQGDPRFSVVDKVTHRSEPVLLNTDSLDEALVALFHALARAHKHKGVWKDPDAYLYTLLYEAYGC